jgi:CRP-like cAMP-binding protein
MNSSRSSMPYARIPVGLRVHDQKTHVLEAEDRALRHPHGFALRCVRASSLFTGLTAAAQLELAESAVQRSFSGRQMIFHEDNPSLYVDVIGTGSVKLTQASQEGYEVILRIERAGSPITELGVPGRKRTLQAPMLSVVVASPVGK